LEEYSKRNFTPGNSSKDKWRKNGQPACIWSHQTVSDAWIEYERPICVGILHLK
jgi:hypothetical protein